MVQTRLHDRGYGNVSTVEDCPTLATVAGGADVTPYEDEDEPETDDETHDDADD